MPTPRVAATQEQIRGHTPVMRDMGQLVTICGGLALSGAWEGISGLGL